MLVSHDPSPVSSVLSDSGSRPAPVPAAPAPEIDSRRLLQGRRELCIRHGGETYRLRHTRNDKLILTK